MKMQIGKKRVFVIAVIAAVSFFVSLNSVFSDSPLTPTLIFTTNCGLAPKDLQGCPRISSYTTPAGYITLRWKTENVSSCTASASANSENWSGSMPTNGTKQIFSGMPGSISYRMTCYNSSGYSVGSSILINVLPTDVVQDMVGNTVSNINNGGTPINIIGAGITDTTGNNGLKKDYSDPRCDAKNIKDLKDLIYRIFIGCIFQNLVYFIILIAVAFFLWGVFKFVTSAGDDKQEGRELMFWGVIGLFVMLSVWGLIAVIHSTIQIGGGDKEEIKVKEVAIPSLNVKAVK